MARRRLVGPDFWDSPVAVKVGYGARLTLIGCWTLADDEGLLVWDPTTLRELLFDSDRDVNDADLSRWMKELVHASAVVPYRAEKRATVLAYLVGFERQHKTGRPKPSRLPAPPRTTQAMLGAYARRDGFVCHLCGGPVQVSGGRVRSGDEPDLTPRVDRLISPAEGGHGYPSNVAVAHTCCVQGRGALSAEDARELPVIAEYGRFARLATPLTDSTLGASGTVEAVVETCEVEALGLIPGHAVEGLAQGYLVGVPLADESAVSTESAFEMEVREAASTGSNRSESDIVGLSDTGNVGLTTKSVSPTLPSSSALSEEREHGSDSPLTCTNAEISATPDTLTEPVVSLSGALTTGSPTEVEVEVEKEREVEGLRASRACSAPESQKISERETESTQPSCAYGAGQEEDVDLSDQQEQAPTAHPHRPQEQPLNTGATQIIATSLNESSASASNTDLSDADGVLDTPHPPALDVSTQAGDDDMNTEESLFDVPADMVHAPVQAPGGSDGENWTPERQQQATDVLNAWWVIYGAHWPQPYPVVYRAVMHALIKGLAPATVAKRLEEHAEKQERITNASLGPRKPSRPVYATDERRAQASTILDQWWTVYGDGWSQTYAIVHRVLVSLLANGMSEDDIKRAMVQLGRERKPISGGTVGFALSKTSKQVDEDAAYERIAASRSVDKYTQRTM